MLHDVETTYMSGGEYTCVSGELMELITEFMYKTFQRESKWRTKKIFMRNCQSQRILFLYWAIAFPQNCYFDMYIYMYIYIYI